MTVSEETLKNRSKNKDFSGYRHDTFTRQYFQGAMNMFFFFVCLFFFFIYLFIYSFIYLFEKYIFKLFKVTRKSNSGTSNVKCNNTSRGQG